MGLRRRSAALQRGPSPAPAAATAGLAGRVVPLSPERAVRWVPRHSGSALSQSSLWTRAPCQVLQMWPLIHVPDDTGGTIPLGLCSCQTGTSIWTQSQAQGFRHGQVTCSQITVLSRHFQYPGDTILWLLAKYLFIPPVYMKNPSHQYYHAGNGTEHRVTRSAGSNAAVRAFSPVPAPRGALERLPGCPRVGTASDTGRFRRDPVMDHGAVTNQERKFLPAVPARNRDIRNAGAESAAKATTTVTFACKRSMCLCSDFAWLPILPVGLAERKQAVGTFPSPCSSASVLPSSGDRSCTHQCCPPSLP